MSEATTKFQDGWAIVELMGHARFAGYCSEESMFGGAMLRIDVPATEEQAAFTKYYGGGAIYAFTPCTEETARRAARAFAARPPHFKEFGKTEQRGSVSFVSSVVQARTPRYQPGDER